MDDSKKLFVGPRLKRLRRELNLSQASMAEELGLSPSYLNLMERNQRPITAQVLIRLAHTYSLDPREFASDDAERTASELEEVFADPLFRSTPVPRLELRETVEAAPGLVDAVNRLYRAYVALRSAREAQAPEVGDRDRAEGAPQDNPVDRVRHLIQEARNYFPELDEAAEALAADLQATGHEPFFAIAERLRVRHGIRVRVMPVDVMSDSLRRYDHHRRQLLISEMVDPSGRTFQAAYQLAFAEMRQTVDDLAARLEPAEGPARRLLRVSLANYFAGALMMPYGKFHAAAEALGYDVEVLGARFGASFEQVAHRLTTLARPGARGIPFFLVRVDSAGNVSKRFSSGRFPFSQYGGTCPLWNVHATFKAPGQIVTQIVELPDMSRWFSVARTVRRASTAWGTPDPQFAVGLGCELKYAPRLVYARGLDLSAPDPTPIGINCRLCERVACPQRAAPPLMHALIVDEMRRGVSPFEFDPA
ncbi:helix-turn-helix domain-containing protein [Microvirga thermotolerans]|uniref:ImmA/IrrE family metallo-endopeptidase n=1 Tax=Microvirga thermotolerans TaxID=2651334 RepID=A0A5P9JUK2_9HYPH|nr:short-chain fatty acyl-CoA regulator family protein [Microvirga thermotolerans]QFU15120.1 ImmA/IrrE family metallo-endopeptidase [Microvirga thermotolerans]